MPGVMETISIVLPLTYVVERLRRIMVMRQSLADVWADLLVLAGFEVGLLVTAVATLRRT
jgi:ABC-2 type transport system permease protein